MSGAIVRRTGTFAKNFAHPGKVALANKNCLKFRRQQGAKWDPEQAGRPRGRVRRKRCFTVWAERNRFRITEASPGLSGNCRQAVEKLT